MNSTKLIENYFSNNLSEGELLEFQNLYETNPEFKQEVDFLNDVKSVSENEDHVDFKRQLASYETEFTKVNKNLFSKWTKPLIAFAAILVIALSIPLMMNNSINEEQLFLDYFEPSKNVSASIVRSQNQQNISTNAFVAYSEKDYENAILLFEEAFKETKNSELLFYEGNALLALGQLEKAIEKFNEHLNYSDVLINRSHWYLALAYLKSKNLEKAQYELKTLIESGETFKNEEANLLLKKFE